VCVCVCVGVCASYHGNLLLPDHSPKVVNCRVHRTLGSDPRELPTSVTDVVCVDVVGCWVSAKRLHVAGVLCVCGGGGGALSDSISRETTSYIKKRGDAYIEITLRGFE
jgi:hypothetical protein